MFGSDENIGLTILGFLILIFLCLFPPLKAIKMLVAHWDGDRNSGSEQSDPGPVLLEVHPDWIWGKPFLFMPLAIAAFLSFGVMFTSGQIQIVVVVLPCILGLYLLRCYCQSITLTITRTRSILYRAFPMRRRSEILHTNVADVRIKKKGSSVSMFIGAVVISSINPSDEEIALTDVQKPERVKELIESLKSS